MPTVRQIIFASAFIFALLSTAFAQDNNSASAQRSSLTVTAAASGERVRITAPSSVVQLHVEVYGISGEKLFDQEIRGGNVFDWHLQDGQAQRLAPGDYVCVVTAKSVSGKLTQKIGTVSVAEKSVSVRAAESKQLSAPQAQTIGPVEENSSWTIAGEDKPQTPTIIAHDGMDGQMIRGRGALTFRIGNFFSGIDKEQMRLTEGGNLGIGTSEPMAKLDVAGTIRAERFLVAKPKPAGFDKTYALAATDAVDSVQPLASGTGTQDRIAKWTDNAGTLGDSVITESAGKIGIGTPTPTQALEVANGRILASGSQTITAPGGILEIGTTVTNNNNVASGIKLRNLFNGNANLQQALDVAPTFAPSASISLARGFTSAAFFAPPPGVTITEAYGGNAVTAYSNTGGAVTNGAAFTLNSPIVFGALKPTTQYGLRINNQGIGGTANSYGLFVDAQSGSTNNYSAIFAGGNVGIGTTSPTAKLMVSGSGIPVDAVGAARFTVFNTVAGKGFLQQVSDNGNWTLASTAAVSGSMAVAVDTTGNVGIGTLTPQSKLEVTGPDIFIGKSQTGKFLGAAGFDFNSASSANGLLIEQAFASSPTESSGIYFDGDSITMWSPGDNNRLLRVLDEDGMGEKFAIDGNGNAIANGVLLTSSRRFKENVAPLANALDKVLRLQGVTFDWKKDRGGKSDIGFVAEDVAKVLPELVLWEKDGKDAVGLEYANLTAVIVEAIKELKAQKDQEIVGLKASNATLQKKLASYDKKLAALEARDQAREVRLTRLENAPGNRPARTTSAWVRRK